MPQSALRSNLISLVLVAGLIAGVAAFSSKQLGQGQAKTATPLASTPVTASAKQYEPIESLTLMLCPEPIKLMQSGRNPEPNSQTAVPIRVYPQVPSGDYFWITLRGQKIESILKRHGVEQPEIRSNCSKEAIEKLSASLLALPGLEDDEIDSKEPEGNVLYTYLEVVTKEHHYRSVWRGLPAAQQTIAAALLDSPALGSQISVGLAAMQSAKASPSKNAAPKSGRLPEWP